MTYYVSMIDKFMSGWGEALNKKNLHIIECNTEYQAEAVKKAAENRPEMGYISISSKYPKHRVHSGVHETMSKFEDLGKVWKTYYHEDHDTNQ